MSCILLCGVDPAKELLLRSPRRAGHRYRPADSVLDASPEKYPNARALSLFGRTPQLFGRWCSEARDPGAVLPSRQRARINR